MNNIKKINYSQQQHTVIHREDIQSFLIDSSDDDAIESYSYIDGLFDTNDELEDLHNKVQVIVSSLYQSDEDDTARTNTQNIMSLFNVKYSKLAKKYTKAKDVIHSLNNEILVLENKLKKQQTKITLNKNNN